MSERILFVDDDESVLAAYRRFFRKDFAVDTALGGAEALRLVADQGPYAVIVSDMQMPGINGIRVLAEVCKRAPDTVRMMLTGQSDLQVAMEAVNQGNIFRFLTKPCPPETMSRALTAGLAQYALVTSEKELLQKTLSGAIKVLCDVLALVNPAAFGRASRVRRLVGQLQETLGLEPDWRVTIAAMLSQLGCVTLPEDVLARASKGRLSPAEWTLFNKHPAIAHDLIASIPRLEAVATIIKYQEKRFDGTGLPRDGKSEEAIPLGARMLKLALDFDALTSSGLCPTVALSEIQGRAGWYDPSLVTALATQIPIDERYEGVAINPLDLRPGMVFAADVVSATGTLLVTKGQEVTPSLRIRLVNIDQNGALAGALQVLVPRRIELRTTADSSAP